MQTSKKGITVVKHYEGFVANPYLCPANVATIGYGTTIYPNGKKVRLSDPKITEAEAVELLQHDLLQFENSVNAYLKKTVTQSQFDALVSFSYNVGSDAFRRSTLLRLLNEGLLQKKEKVYWKPVINREFGKWVKAKGRTLKGLVNRRCTEAFLFCDDTVKFFN